MDALVACVRPLTQIPMAGYLEGYILKPKKFRHPKNTGWLHTTGSGYCNNWQSAAFTATNKLQYNSAVVCRGKKLKISEYLLHSCCCCCCNWPCDTCNPWLLLLRKKVIWRRRRRSMVSMLHCWVHTGKLDQAFWHPTIPFCRTRNNLRISSPFRKEAPSVLKCFHLILIFAIKCWSLHNWIYVFISDVGRNDSSFFNSHKKGFLFFLSPSFFWGCFKCCACVASKMIEQTIERET